MNPCYKLFPADRVQPHIRLQQKLYRCVPQLSQAMAAVAAFIVGYQFVHPKITEIAVTAEGAVIARIEGEPTCAFISDYDDLTRNWIALLSTSDRVRTDVCGWLLTQEVIARLLRRNILHTPTSRS